MRVGQVLKRLRAAANVVAALSSPGDAPAGGCAEATPALELCDVNAEPEVPAGREEERGIGHGLW